MYSHQKHTSFAPVLKGNAISNYFFSLAEALRNDGNKVVIVVDKKNTNIKEYNGIPVVTWPSKRPTKLKDFIFFYKLCKQYKPDVTLGQFGATNVVLMVSKLLGIRNRWVYWHTMFLQIQTDSKSSSFKLWLLELRKNYYCAVVPRKYSPTPTLPNKTTLVILILKKSRLMFYICSSLIILKKNLSKVRQIDSLQWLLQAEWITVRARNTW